MDNIDTAIEQFNVEVTVAQLRAQRLAAADFARQYSMTETEAFRLLAACQWSVTKAAKRLRKP